MMRRVIFACVILSSTGLGACGSDPASEEPIQLTPGLYEVSYSAAANTFPGSSGSELDEKVCVHESDAATFPQSYPRKFFSKMGSSCGGPQSDRVGNKLTGKVVCAMQNGVTGDITINFEGEVASQSLDVRSKLQVNVEADPTGRIPDDIDMSVLDALELRLSLLRVGDCPA